MHFVHVHKHTRTHTHARQYTYLLLIDAIARGQQSEAAANVLEQHVHVVERRRETKGAHIREPRGAGRRLIEQKEQQVDEQHLADRLVLDAGCGAM